MKFSDVDLKPEFQEALEQMGYVDMTPIQEKAIPHIIQGSDLMGLAETGSGKTAACGVPMVNSTDPDLNAIQHLILVPTRELALQYVQELDDLAGESDVVPFAVFGGFDIGIQKAKLRHKVHILVATPGRLIDLIWNTKLLDLTHVRTVVLDEADEMLKMGFIEDVDFILDCILQQHQTLLFSATMPKEIDRLAGKFLKDPVKIELNRDQRAPQSLQHHFLHTGRDRLKALTDILQHEEITQAIIFCNSRDKVTDLYRELRRIVTSVEAIHGGLDQGKRISIFMRFKEKKIKFMVATDVAGRGLDFSHASHVINYDFPFNPEIYTHRTGRTGRMGRTGIALTLVANRDLANLKVMIGKIGIEPQWRGREPDLDAVNRGRSRGNSKRKGAEGSNSEGRRRSSSSRRRGSSRNRPAAA